jgi:ABC-2 type transport system ATP-binding protein
MVEIAVDSVCVEFPVYDVQRRSARAELLRVTTGGKISRERGRVTIVALDGVSFALCEGDRLGLVGQNGSGKTTLLRVLAGIYEPTRGAVRVAGQVVPLFNTMIGIDQESTGRENIKLQGLLIGMSPAEIAERTGDIIAFSELGSYIDMPIRTYSMGMITRLAFSIATARDPEVLLLDEMIGTADAGFMQRAEKRLESFLSYAGILVLASHSESVVRRICNKAALIQQGKLVGFGSVDEIFASYASSRSG